MAILSNFQANGQEAIKLAPPTQSVALTYTGNAQSPTWTEYPTSVITVTSTPQTNAGTYNATAAIPAGYVWADTLKGGQRNIPWTIGKASGGTIVLSKNAVEIGEGESDTVTATLTGAGDTLSAVSSDSSVAAVSVSGNTITITDGGTEGTATITVSADGNYAYTDVMVSVEVSYGPTIVTWAGGTDAEIVAMCEASDQGKLDLLDCWNIGDERTVSLSAMAATYVGESHEAQNVTMVIVNKGGYGATDGTSSAFIVQQKDCLATVGYMNSSNTNSGGWNSCKRRSWCNNVYKNAIPSTLIDIFKQVQVLGVTNYASEITQTSEDYFFLPAAAEIWKGDNTYGTGGVAGQTTAYSNLVEFNALSRWTYYETASNRIKKLGLSGSATTWWERSHNQSSTGFCVVSNSGGASGANAALNVGLAPAGCIGTANNGNGIIVPSWTTGTNQQIEDAIKASNDGKIDLADYWNIGDIRVVSLSSITNTSYVNDTHRSQRVQMVLVDKNNSNYQYNNPTLSKTYCSFIVQQKDCLSSTSYSSLSDSEFGCINTTQTNAGGWDSCARRSWCNEVYKNALPSIFKNNLKQVKVKTINNGGSSGTSLVNSIDYCFLPAEKEVIGSQINSNAKETSLSLWKYYETSDNRIKHIGYVPGVPKESCYWWTRSPYRLNTTHFCYIKANGGYAVETATYTLGLAPCFCI